MIQGGSGVKTREILASRQGDFAIADIIHVLQLNKNGRPTRALNTVDQRAPGVRFAVRKDLYDQGIDTVQKAAAWKRPDDKKAIFGVSSLGGTSHLWSHYFMESMGLADKVTWLGVGNVDTMLGTLKTKQIDVLSSAISVMTEAEKKRLGQGDLLALRSHDLEFRDRRPGAGERQFLPHRHDREGAGEGPGLHQRHVALQAMDQEEQSRGDPGYHRALRRRDLAQRQPARDRRAQGGRRLERPITPESYARGEKVWYSELTGIKQPIKLEDAVADKFLKAAHAKYPA